MFSLEVGGRRIHIHNLPPATTHYSKAIPNNVESECAHLVPPRK